MGTVFTRNTIKYISLAVLFISMFYLSYFILCYLGQRSQLFIVRLYSKKSRTLRVLLNIEWSRLAKCKAIDPLTSKVNLG